MDISEALKFDPLAAAETITGHSYKDDADTMTIGMALGMAHNKAKAAALRDSLDSYYNMPFADALDLFADLGFAEVLHDNFAGTYGPEEYVILWHPDGILATCESYMGDRNNSSKILYNYRHHDGRYPSGLTSSGHMFGEVWVGDHDAREGVRHNLDALRAEGEFLPVWVERQFLWLLTYMDSKVEGYDYQAITAERVNRLPENVRRAITPETEA